MAGRLSRALDAGGRGRIAAFAAVIAVVVLAHAWLTSELAERLGSLDSAAAMPARIEVAYVRTLEPEAARPLAPVAVAPAAVAPPAPRAPRRIARAASAPAREPPASAPVPTAVAEAASEPPVLAAAAPASSPAPPASTPPASVPSTAPLLADAGAASAPAGAASGATFAWPTATRISYLLNGNWRGELNGRAEVEWIRVGDRYQVNVFLFAGLEFAPVYSRRMTSEGRIQADGLSPDRYAEETKLIGNRRQVGVGFTPEAVVLANGQQRERLPGVQDTASQFIQFTWMFGSDPDKLKVGNSFEFPLALPRSMNRWTYDVADQETLHTPFGPLAAFHLTPRRAVRRPGEWLVEMWFAPELRFLPVKIHIEQDGGTFADLTIARKPEIAGP